MDMQSREGDPKPAEAPHKCQWCSAVTPQGATHCPTCGASLAERESLGDIPIPGVTEIDPALPQEHDPLHTVMVVQGNSMSPNALGGRSPLNALPGGFGFGLAMGAALVKGFERLAQEQPDPSLVGKPSAAALSLAKRLDGGEQAPSTPDEDEPSAPSSMPPDPWVDLPVASGDPQAGTANVFGGGTAASPANDTSDPWAGTSNPADDPWAGAANDPWAAGPGPWAGDPWADPANDPWASTSGPWSGDPQADPKKKQK